MNELAIRGDHAPVVPHQPIGERPMRLVEWAEEARAASALAQSLCQTPFAGQYRGDAMGATAAILKGAEVGLTPVTSLGAFDLIQGTPAPKAITLRALVQAHGHSVWIEHSTDTECVAKARRQGESVVHESKWTMKRAQQMSLANKPNWKNQPAAMLMARATSEVCRLVAADVILGIGYSSEEVQDSQPEPVTTLRRTATAEPKRTARRAAAPAPEPDLEPPPLAASDPIPTDNAPQPEPAAEATITRDQLTRLHASFGDLGITDRDDRLRYVSGVLGHNVESSKDLTKSEASQVLDAINTDLSGGAA
jgi:hypothetical protein